MSQDDKLKARNRKTVIVLALLALAVYGTYIVMSALGSQVYGT